MSTPVFLLLAFVSGTVAIGLLFLLFKLLDPLLDPFLGTESSLQRLQRRRDRRLARGQDRYFEELRSIDSAIASHLEIQQASGERKWRPRPATWLLLPWSLFLGGWVLGVFAPMAGLGPIPSSATNFGMSWLILVGASYLLEPEPTIFRIDWQRYLTGAAMIAVGVAAIASDFSRS
ncbi:hypothetical protein [Sphingomonas hengshuiensis]|uniref:hypothetical protein n=1 Tax=Sphingomonas hengshuiensis TaxID=1609977 RepID=UPI000A95FFE3|nr:hypothetical protein [Sphingomonas hengshuiensis]